MTTFTSFVSALSDLSVSGVNRTYSHPPASLEDLPAKWVQMVVGDESSLTLNEDGSGGVTLFRAQLVVAYESFAQGTQPDNWEGTLTMMDSVATALRGVSRGTLCEGRVTWVVRASQVRVGDTPYWAVVADVTGRGRHG
jgi:hypothetical protein